jgi:hypothetical protein
MCESTLNPCMNVFWIHVWIHSESMYESILDPRMNPCILAWRIHQVRIHGSRLTNSTPYEFHPLRIPPPTNSTPYEFIKWESMVLAWRIPPPTNSTPYEFHPLRIPRATNSTGYEFIDWELAIPSESPFAPQDRAANAIHPSASKSLKAY